jgi:hypothetical protein
MGVTEELEKAQGLLASGDIADLLRYLRAHGEALPLGEVARLVAGAARLAGFDDLAQAAAAVAAAGGDGSGTEDPRALYGFGYACLDRRDLRGWHYVLTCGVLASLSPYGFDAGMTGRWAYVSDTLEGCAAALARLKLILDAAGTAPQSVTLLPDRSSRILGAAAAAVLGLPATDFDPGKPAANSLVVAYDLTQTDPDAIAALRDRAPGQVLFERATCWTDPPRVTADVTGLLGQTVIPPWAGQLRRLDDGTAGHGPADDRPVEAVAPTSPAPRLSRTKATATLPRTPTKTCAVSSKRSRPQARANATAAGSAASASTSPTPARYPAAASYEPTLESSLTATSW